MSYYKMGLAVADRSSHAMTPYQRGTHVGGFQVWRGIKTPGMIRDEINRIHSEFLSTGKALYEEIDKANEWTQDTKRHRFFAQGWSPFYQQWENFRNNHQGFTDNLWGDTWDDAQTWQKSLIKMRANAEAAGFDLSGTISPTKTESDASLPSISSILWTVIKFSIVGGIILLVVMFIKGKGQQ